MSLSRLLGALAVVVTGIALIVLARAASLPTTHVQAMDLSTPGPTPTHQKLPIGIEIPLGRYSEPADPSPELVGDGSPAPSVLSGTSPAMGTNFDGVGMELDSNLYVYAPPDTHSATGLDRIVEVTNGHVAIYDKSGGLIAGGDTGVGAVSLNDFCGSAGPPTEDGCYDPKVIYDQASDRFVAVVLQGKTAATSKLHVMVSKTSSPANLTSDWDKFSHSASANIGGTDGWFDYPGLGVSPDAVVVTGNMFPDAGVFLGTKIRIFDKAELYDGDATATYQDIDNTSAIVGFSIQPAHHLSSPPSGTFYLLSRWNPTYLAVWALTGVSASPVLSGTLVATSDQGTCVPAAPQMGTSKEVDTVCPRMMDAVWRDGSLWGTLTGSDATNSRAVVQWFEIETNGYPSAAPSLRQHGAIDGGVEEFIFMPSISVDANGNAAVTYSQSSSSRYPEMRYTARRAGDSLNAMRDPVVAKTSVSFYDDFGDAPERWGDYSSTVIDPSDGSFWISHEYVKVAASGAEDDGRWGTWHANFTFALTSTVYLPVVLNNYDPSELLRNGNFDTGLWTPWQTLESPTLDDQVYNSASYSARLAGRNNVDSDYVAQEVTVPSNATEVTLDFWYRVSGNDSSAPEDFMCVEILDSGFSTVLLGIDCLDLYAQPQNQWTNYQYAISGAELTPILGQTVFVSFQGWTDATNPGTVWVDDVSFQVTSR